MLINVKSLVSSINYLWSYLKLQTQIILTTAALILIIVNNIAYSSDTISRSLPNLYNKFPFVDNITLILSDQLSQINDDASSKEVSIFCEQFYKRNANIRYLLYINKNGNTYSIPYSYNEIQTLYNLANIQNIIHLNQHASIVFTNNNKIVSLIILLNPNDMSRQLIIGNNNPNFSLINNTLFSTLASFILVSILGSLLIKIRLNRPLNEITNGLKKLANGNFSNQINIQYEGKFGEVIGNYNELSRRLKFYEVKNSEQLNNEKKKLESIITTITDGIILLDTNLNIVLLNTTAIRNFNLKNKTNLIGTSIWNYLPITLQKKLFVALQNALINDSSATIEGKVGIDFDKSTQKLIRITLKLVYDSSTINKIPIGVGVTIQDRTAEFELNRTQSRFISNISHELRTPLFNIKSFIETIQEYSYTISNYQKKYFLDIANKETNRLTRLVNDILSISKLDSQKEIILQKINILEISNQTLASYQLLSRTKKLYLHSETELINTNVFGNYDLLFQVLMNLVGNALKFTYKYGEVLVRFYNLNTVYIRVEIIDTGVGINLNYQPYIFQRFYRIENAIHTLKGTGLGLSIVNAILLEHNTKVRVVSRAKVGSAFWFDLKREK